MAKLQQQRNYSTIAGVMPEESRVFVLKTSDAENFINTQIEAVCAKMKTADFYAAELTSIDFAKRQHGFLMVLPNNVVLSKKDKDNKTTDIDSIFEANYTINGTKKAKIVDPYAGLIEKYCYTKYEVSNMINNYSYKKMVGINDLNCRRFLEFRRPKLQTDRNNFSSVIVCVDPMKVFHEMLTFRDDDTNEIDRRPFDVNITGIKKIGDGDYIYYLEKVFRNKNTKKNKMFGSNLAGLKNSMSISGYKK